MLSSILCLAQTTLSPTRTWTWNGRSYEGKIEAKHIASVEQKAGGVKDEAQILMVDGSRLFLDISELSQEDQKFVEKWSNQEQAAKRLIRLKARNHEVYYNAGVAMALFALILAVWKKRRSFDTKRLKAVYLVWTFINFLLLIFASDPFNKFGSSGIFYPFIPARGNDLESGIFFNHIDVYDITEFLFYSICPFVVWYAVRLWRPGNTSISSAGKVG